MTGLLVTINDMNEKAIKEKLDPSELMVACNPKLSEGFKDALAQGFIEPDLANFGVRAYYTDSLAEQLVHEPDEYVLEHLDISDDIIKDLLMLETVYDLVMFVDL